MTYGDSFLPIDFAAVFAALRGLGRAGAHDRVPQRGALGHQQRHLRRAAGRRSTTSSARTRPAADFAFIDYGSQRAVAPGGRGRGFPPAASADLGDALPRAERCAASWPGSRSRERFYEIGSPAGPGGLRAMAARPRPDRPRPRRRAQPPAPEPGRAAPRQPDAPERGGGLPLGAGGAARADARRVRPRASPATSRPPPRARPRAPSSRRRTRRCWPRRTATGGVILSSHICFHRAEDGCACRKPRDRACSREAFARHPAYDRGASWMVGDRAPDVLAGAAFGLRTALVGDVAAEDCADAGRARRSRRRSRGGTCATWPRTCSADPSGAARSRGLSSARTGGPSGRTAPGCGAGTSDRSPARPAAGRSRWSRRPGDDDGGRDASGPRPVADTRVEQAGRPNAREHEPAGDVGEEAHRREELRDLREPGDGAEDQEHDAAPEAGTRAAIADLARARGGRARTHDDQQTAASPASSTQGVALSIPATGSGAR